MDKQKKKKENKIVPPEFFPPVPPEDAEDTAFDITSVASANECTGIGHIFPDMPDNPEDLIMNSPDTKRE